MNDKENVLLIGPPNVGKSVTFNNLTGSNISIANYVGTTVEFTVGEIIFDDYNVNLIDVPGTYTLEATNEAEKIAVEMLQGHDFKHKKFEHCHDQKDVDANLRKKPAAVISVIDAYNLESSLYLLFQVLQYNIPTVAVLNRMDLIEEKGEKIDVEYLSYKLGIPVIPTVAVEKKGLNELKEILQTILAKAPSTETENIRDIDNSKIEESFWQKAEEIVSKAKFRPSVLKKSKREIWGERLVKPWPGLPLSILILGLVFALIVGLGMGLRQFLLLPLFREYIIPVISLGVEAIVAPGTFQNILIGEYGLFVKGLEWPFTLVMPYVISFYIAFSILEDSGYLPRLGSLLDGLLNKLGLPGSSIIPLLLGYGCGIPAIMATRSLNSYKERMIVTTLVCLGIPCVAQSGAFIALLGEESILALLLVFFFSLFVIFVTGFIIDKLLPGSRPYTIMEIPELLVPRSEVIFNKIWFRTKNYIYEGALPMIAIIGVAAFFYETGVMGIIGQLLSPLVVTWLHLPAEASTPLILGIFRRELAIVPLVEMDLTTLQLFTGAIVGLFYVPCVAIIATLAREFNLKFSVFILIITTTIAFLIGGAIARIGGLFF
ncbi:Ferrous iron transporter FeoB [Candidatus Syntrophocurvum alkaliphilum]|uniref:Ferrous iron transporter FeoB n=1 Tax=Candidatus Syntrophocurvum alkaliphilum TaxID=2293317 RepID=A0A6I6DFD8_9FIRM|nr:ferrous iron transporter B [Candidatus Syntrophocurvum alkaliphilum]QGT99344.1 Ferrous iron transporter FeoB [Candidatus Syntrophocurvum alkaliphilum]